MILKVIKNPSGGTVDILLRRISGRNERPESFDSVGLIQGKMIEMIVASDIAQKATGVVVEDIHGSCPQNMIMLAIFGETSAVESAMMKIKEGVNSHPYAF